MWVRLRKVLKTTFKCAYCLFIFITYDLGGILTGMQLIIRLHKLRRFEDYKGGEKKRHYRFVDINRCKCFI